MKVVLSFTMTFYLTKSILLMIKCQIDMTELCWSANITSFSDLINYFWNEHLIKERWRSQCPSTMLFSTEHTHEHATEHAHEFFNAVSVQRQHRSLVRYNADTTSKNKRCYLFDVYCVIINFILVSEFEWKYTIFTLVRSYSL